MAIRRRRSVEKSLRAPAPTSASRPALPGSDVTKRSYGVAARLAPGQVVVDVIPKPEITPLLAIARECGAAGVLAWVAEARA